MKKIILLCSFIIFFYPTIAQTYDTINIHFPLNNAKLSKDAIKALDSLVFKDVLIHGQKFTVLGYTDYLGGKSYNEELSKTRAKNVKDYLITMGFEDKDIMLCTGKGKIDHVPVKGKEGIESDRKVQIIIDGNPSIQSVTQGPQVKTQAQVKGTTKIDVAALKVNQSLNLKNIHFYSGRHDILPESESELINLYLTLKENPKLKIMIEGHICCPDNTYGSDVLDEDNSGLLSETRAKAVYKYIVAKGIEPSRMKYRGFGNTRMLVNPEITDNDRTQNRRVEIRIISK